MPKAFYVGNTTWYRRRRRYGHILADPVASSGNVEPSQRAERSGFTVCSVSFRYVLSAGKPVSCVKARQAKALEDVDIGPLGTKLALGVSIISYRCDML